MVALNQLVLVCLVYVAGLFAVAFLAERAALRGGIGWFLRSPLIYTLSLSIYCTAWTFYGAVGYAARSGMEFVTIYLGPSLVMIGWWWVLRKLVRVGRTQRVTSVADLISSRYGKSNVLAIIVTVMAVVGVTPYIALQLQSVTLSLSIFADPTGTTDGGMNLLSAGFWVALGLALFTVLFGTRNLNANERHDGVVIAIAVEAVVKLVALLAVGIFVVWGIAGGVGEMMTRTVTKGTAKKAFWDQKGRPFLPGISVAGKTGTLSRYNPHRTYNWWVGYAPVDDPKIAVAALVVNEPKWRIKASYVAREALRKYLVH